MQIIPGENLNYGAQNTCTIVFGLKAYAYRLSRLVPQGTVVCVDCSRAATSGRAPRLALGWLSAGSRLALGWLVGELLESWRESQPRVCSPVLKGRSFERDRRHQDLFRRHRRHLSSSHIIRRHRLLDGIS